MIVERTVVFSIHDENADTPEKLIPFEEWKSQGIGVIDWKVYDRDVSEPYWCMGVRTQKID